jgi:hypothetical protein
VVIGTWQIIVIAYVLFIALGPKRVVRWIRWTTEMNARLRGKPPPPQRKTRGWLRAIELFEYSSQIGWACLVIGAAMAIYAGTLDGFPPGKALLLGLGMLLLFLAPWLI